MKQKSSLGAGFTLIELMIVVAILGILSAIAYPNYTAYVQRSNRAQLKTIMLENAQILERFSTEANSYNVNTGGGTPAIFNQSPKPNQGTLAYGIAIVSDATTFTLTATRTVGGPMAGDACGDFTLNQLGQKGLTGYTLSTAECWGR